MMSNMLLIMDHTVLNIAFLLKMERDIISVSKCSANESAGQLEAPILLIEDDTLLTILLKLNIFKKHHCSPWLDLTPPSSSAVHG